MAKSKSNKDESKPKLIVKKWGTPQPILIGTPRFGMVFIQGFGDYSYTIANVDKKNEDDYPDIDEYIKTILLSALQESLTRFSKTRLALEVIGNTRSVAKETFEIAKKDCNQIGVSLEGFQIGNLGLSSRVDKELRDVIEKAEKDYKESQIISWTKVKDIIVTLGAVSGILAGILWLGGRFYTYGYFERMNIPIYFLNFSAAEYAEVYITTIAAKLIVAIITNFLAILIGVVLALAVGVVLWIIQKRYRKLRFRDALQKIEKTNNKFLVFSFIILFFASFFIAYSSGDAAAQYFLMNSRTVAVFSREMLALGTTSTANHQSPLYEYKDLYLLTHNDGKYYLFRELDMATCKPKQIYVVAESDLVSVNIGETVSLPKCSITP